MDKNRHNRDIHPGALCAVTLAIVWLGLVQVMSPAVAQTEDEAMSMRVLDEITVTAKKREQNIQDVGITVNAYDAKTINELALRNAQDIAALTPGFDVRPSAAGSMPILTVRGVGSSSTDTLLVTTPPSVAVHVDEVYFGAPNLLMFSQFDLERVELLKGPQGTLFGRNTTAGSLNYITAKPRSEFDAGLDMSVGAYDTEGGYYEIQGFVTGSIADSLDGRFAIYNKQGDSYYRNLNDVPYAGPDTIALRTTLDWEQGEKFRARLNIHGGSDESGPLVGQAFLIGDAPGSECPFDTFDEPRNDLANCITLFPPRTPQIADDGSVYEFARSEPQFDNDVWRNGYSGAPRRNSIETIGGYLRLDWDMGGFQVVSLSSYDFSDVSRDDIFVFNDLGSERTGVEPYTDEIEQFSQELRAQGQMEKLTWLLGGYFFKEDIENTRIGYLFDEQRFSENPRTIMASQHETTSYAAFGDIQFDLSESLSVVGGLRYTYEEKEYARQVSYNFQRNAAFDVLDTNFVPIRPNPITGEFPERYVRQEVCPCDEDWDDVDWKIGLNYRPSDEALLFALVSNGFKSGVYSGSSIINPPELAIAGEPESLTSYEIGIKSEWMNNTLRINVSGFYYDFEDMQISTVVGTPQGFTTLLDNAAQTEIYGLDVDALWLPAEGLTLQIVANFLDGEYTEFISVDVFNNTVTDFSGADVINTPDVSATFFSRYEKQFGSFLAYVSGEVIHTGEVDFSFRDDVPLAGDFNRRAYRRDPVTQVNARVGVQTDSGVDLMFFVTNATNEEVLLNLRTGLGEINGQYAAPRSYGVRATISF